MKTGQIKILYDGACPVCSAEMNFLKRRDSKNLIILEDISKSDLDISQHNKTKEELNKFIHAVLPDGTIISGVEVFRQAYSAVGLGFLLWPTTLPAIKQMADIAYAIFARYRMPISRLLGRKVSDSCEIQ